MGELNNLQVLDEVFRRRGVRNMDKKVLEEERRKTRIEEGKKALLLAAKVEAEKKMAEDAKSLPKVAIPRNWKPGDKITLDKDEVLRHLENEKRKLVASSSSSSLPAPKVNIKLEDGGEAVRKPVVIPKAVITSMNLSDSDSSSDEE